MSSVQSVLPLDESFAALRLTVADMLARDRVTRYAGVKALMQRREPAFDERAFGFGSFGEFVAAAAERGGLRIDRDSDGWERVHLVGSHGDEDQGDEHLRVRPDLWKAFTNWGGRWINVWLAAESRVVPLARDPRDPEPAELAALRRALTERSPDVTRIEPIPMETQRQWLSDFIAEMPGEHWLHDALTRALDDDQPFRRFGAFLRADADQLRRYYRFRAQRVIEIVTTWARDNGIEVDPTAQPDVESSAAAFGATPATPGVDPTVGGGGRDVREVILRAVQQMPTDELRRLPIPVGYILDALR
jgi:hypothetical protein